MLLLLCWFICGIAGCHILYALTLQDPKTASFKPVDVWYALGGFTTFIFALLLFTLWKLFNKDNRRL